MYFRVFGERFALVADKASCLRAVAGVIKVIAYKLKVSATCVVDITSGLPEYPIHGKLKFTQRVSFFLCLSVALTAHGCKDNGDFCM